MDFEDLISRNIWIVNKKDKGKKDGIYIGRGSILGNRFLIGKDGDREEVIAKYRVWLWGEVKKKQAVFGELRRLLKIWKRDGEITLVCFCFPKRCHGEVVGSCLAWMDK